MTEPVCQLFADSSGLCVPGKDEEVAHCRSDMPKSEVFVLVGLYEDSDDIEDGKPWIL